MVARNVEADRRATVAGMHVHESGDPGSPAVVLLQGAGGSGRMWSAHMARLAGFHCLAPDLPGFGRSNHMASASRVETAELVAELIERRIPAQRAHVVGLSWGGGVAHTLLDRHPELVDRAVIDGAGVLASRGGTIILLGLAMTAPFLHTRPVVSLLSAIIGMDEVGREDLRASSRRAFWRAFVEGSRPSVSRVEVAATSPILLVAGEKETAIRSSNAALASLMTHAAARFAPGLGHGWMAREEDLHVRMVEAWLTGQELPTGLVPEPPSPQADERLLRELGKEERDANDRLAARSR
jgi:pimeloyl-ACP methyl ester carboxylesterase